MLRSKSSSLALASNTIIDRSTVMDIKELQQETKKALDTATAELKAQSLEAAALANKLIDGLKGDVGKIDAKVSDALTEVNKKAQQTSSEVTALAQKLDIALKLTPVSQATKSFADKIVESDQYKAAKDGVKMDRVEVGTFWDRKAAIVNATGQNQPLVPAERAPMVQPLEQPLSIRDLLPVSRTDSNLIEYVRELVYTNSAAIVYNSPNYENVTKPESGITFSMLTAAVATIAHWIPASRQVLSDAQMLRGYIENRLLYGLKLEEEDEILNGDGTPGHLDGLMKNATAYAGNGAVSADTKIDTLLRALTQTYVNGLVSADGIVLHPYDWQAIRLIKDTQGRYVFGDPDSNQTPSVWGTRLVQSLSIAQTRFLVGAFRMAAMLWDRENADVRIAEQHADFFIKNMVAILAEERLALTVFRPTAMTRGNFVS
jgi:HK97 family phage major capsid protein